MVDDLQPLGFGKNDKNPFINLESLKSKMDYTFKNGKIGGEKTNFYPIDKINCFTWKKGFMYCITGNPGSGKSEFVGHLAILKSYFDKWKWAVYSPESYPAEDYIDTLIHGFIGKSTDPRYSNYMTQNEYDRGFNFIRDHFMIADYDEMPTLDNIEFMISESGDCDGVIIDPFNSIDSNSTEIMSENLKMSLTKIRNLGRKYKKVIVLIEHPKTNSMPLDGNEMPKEPTEYSLYGGSMWHNKCDVIAVVHRPFARDKTNTITTFRTTKIKNQKLHGFPDVCEFHFDRRSNRYFWRNEMDGKEFDSFKNFESGYSIQFSEDEHECPF